MCLALHWYRSGEASVSWHIPLGCDNREDLGDLNYSTNAVVSIDYFRLVVLVKSIHPHLDLWHSSCFMPESWREASEPPLCCEQQGKEVPGHMCCFSQGTSLPPASLQRAANTRISTGLARPVATPQSKMLFPDLLSSQNPGFTSPSAFLSFSCWHVGM